MLQTKRMPHRGQIMTAWALENGVVIIQTLRHSAKHSVPGELRLIPIRDDLVKIEMTEGETPPHHPSISVLLRDITGMFTVVESDTYLTITTTSLRIEISKSYCALRYYDLV